MGEVELRLRETGGILARGAHRDLAGSLDRWLRTGRLVGVLPGVYCLPALVHEPLVRARAALLWAGPDAVLTGLTAARVTYWPSAPAAPVTLALPPGRRREASGVEVERRAVPAELVLECGPWRTTEPWATAVDLAAGPYGGSAIDEALRTRSASLTQMWAAFQLQPDRPGNHVRRLLLDDSRDEPWSEAERDCHRLLRSAGIGGWRANQWVAGYWVDVLFRQQRLVIEVDGWATHSSRTAFENDRARRNALVLAGYTVLNFTWRQLQDEPEWVVSCVLEGLALTNLHPTRSRGPRAR